MERSRRKTKLEVFCLAWRENTLSYKKALKTARYTYFTSHLEEKNTQPKYLFNTVAKPAASPPGLETAPLATAKLCKGSCKLQWMCIGWYPVVADIFLC